MCREKGRGRPVVAAAWLGAGVLVEVAWLMGCALENPQVPSLEFPLSLAVVNDTTTMAEVAQDRESFLAIDQDNLLDLDFTVEFGEPDSVGERLSVRPIDNAFVSPLGNLTLPGRTLLTAHLTLNDVSGGDLPEGAVGSLPAWDFSSRLAAPAMQGITSADVEAGTVEVSVTNGLPVGLAELTLSLVDAGRGDALLDEVSFHDVAPGATVQGAFDLAGRSVSGTLAVDVAGRTEPRSDATVQGGQTLDITALMSPLTVSAGIAQMPVTQITGGGVLDFPDDRIQVYHARVESGELRMDVRNELSVPIEVELRLDDLRRPDGSVSSVRLESLDGGRQHEVRFPLAGNDFDPVDPLHLRVSYVVRTQPPERDVSFQAGSAIRISAQSDSLVFSRVEGVPNGISVPVAPTDQGIDFPSGLDNLSLASTSMAIYMTSAVGFVTRIELDIYGENQTGETASLQVSQVFAAGDPEHPVAMVLAPDSEELTRLVNLLPSLVTVSPQVFLGDGTSAGVIEKDHWIRIDSVRFIAPGRLTIAADTQIRPDPQFHNFQDEDARRRVESNLVEASIVTSIENHLPLGVKVNLQVATWHSIVRHVVERARPDLADDAALLQWLLGSRAWEVIGWERQDGVRRRMADELGLAEGALDGLDDAAIAARLGGGPEAEARQALLIRLVLGSLENDRRDRGVRQVEDLVGQEISADEWDGIITERVYDHPDLTIPPEGGPFEVESGRVDAGGLVVEGRRSSRTVGIDTDQMLVLLRRGGIYTGTYIELEGTGGEISLSASDYVAVQAAARVVLELNEDLVKD
ncbi:MAG: hypothetical protein AB1505_25915 [Candidatus Latescibacterota bacterium]